MATNIDKALYQAPVGLDAEAPNEDTFEIEIIDGDADPDQMADVLDSLKGDNSDEFNKNLAEELEDGDIATALTELSEAIDNDKASRKDWEKAYTEGLKLLGLQYEERTQPWDGASGVFHPMITEAVVRFQSEAITETFPAQGPVRTKIKGKETPEKKEAAQRVEDDMNYALTEEMREYRPEHERMLWSLPATGSAFKKVYFDPNLDRQVAMFIPAEDMLLPYGTSDLDTCYRVTHVMRKTKNDIIKLQQAGFYRDVELPDPTKERDDIKQAKDKETGFSDINDERYVLYESHVDLVIKGDKYCDKDKDGDPIGVALPYVFTYIKDTQTVLAIRRNWKEDDEQKLKRQHFVHYQYIPGFGAYGFGLFHLIGGFAKSATSIMRQLVDAGTLSNLPGGLKSRGLRIKGDDTPIAPGEFRDVDVGSGAIKDNILPLPYKEPSAVLSGLLDKIVEEGRRFAATADMQVSDMSAQAPVGTTLALLERQLKVMTAVQARLHFSLKQELGLIAGIIRDYTDDDYDYDPEYGTRKAKQADYDNVDIIPVSDPNAATMSQRVVQYQAVIQMAQMAPEIYDLPYLHRQMLEVLGIKHADKLVPLEEDQKPKDPVSENMAILKCEPVKAFSYQDHQSHIQVHMAAMQDPIVMQLVGQNPKAPQIQAAMMAHIADHVGLGYRQKIEQQLGAALPSEDENLPPEAEKALSAMMAQAAAQVLAASKTQVAQQQAAAAAQDPVVQQQQQDLQIRQQEVQIKGQKVQGDLAIAQQKLQLEAQKTQAEIQAKGPSPEQQALEQAQQVQQMQLTQQEAQRKAQQATLQHRQELVNRERQQHFAGAQAEQAARHREQAHQMSLTQKDQQHRQNMELRAQQAKQQAADKPPKKKE
jgi:hypothetical protein